MSIGSTRATHLNRLDSLFKMDGSRGMTTGPISRSGPSCAFCCLLLSIGGNGDIDHSELDDELPGEFSLDTETENKLIN